MAKKKVVLVDVTSRSSCIAAIDAAGKREEFEAGWLTTLEDYFEMYCYQEPEVWFNVLNDLEIPFKQNRVFKSLL